MATQGDALSVEKAHAYNPNYLSKKQQEKLNKAILNDIVNPLPHGKASVVNRLRAKSIFLSIFENTLKQSSLYSSIYLPTVLLYFHSQRAEVQYEMIF